MDKKPESNNVKWRLRFINGFIAGLLAGGFWLLAFLLTGDTMFLSAAFILVGLAFFSLTLAMALIIVADDTPADKRR